MYPSCSANGFQRPTDGNVEVGEGMNQMIEHKVEWIGPFLFIGPKEQNLFLRPEADRRGIYLWTVEGVEGYLVHYVGQTAQSFGVRFQQHIKDQLSGVYSIYDPSDLVEGKPTKRWEGMWWKAGAWKRTADFINNLMEHSKWNFELLKIYRIFLAPPEHESRILERIEAAIVDCLRSKEGVVASMQDPKIRYRWKLKKEASFKVRFVSPCSILGLPEELLIRA